ncbi:hypothetical protein FB45DRAFT_885542 [Roridomyces roridus]|uniref:Uncharacterized protein n=1 Tax=Roridomyces roridus TaxID=1738132 RepID=A0AAD7FXY4_9AGAR|nr:hypothetical protein FB45DRAFT_885542 [Roridomyces roridus]
MDPQISSTMSWAGYSTFLILSGVPHHTHRRSSSSLATFSTIVLIMIGLTSMLTHDP